MDSINKIVIFTAGVAIGVAASWKFFENKYKKIAQEEIDSVKEVFSRKEKTEKEEAAKPEEEDEAEVDDQEVVEYSKVINNLGYSKEIANDEKGGVTVARAPYVIPPDEFGEDPEYGTESLTYYADGVLTDDFDHEIEDVESMVGEESLTHFGEYEEDSVFVRNEEHKTDYEILRDERKFSDVPKRTSYSVND